MPIFENLRNVSKLVDIVARMDVIKVPRTICVFQAVRACWVEIREPLPLSNSAARKTTADASTEVYL